MKRILRALGLAAALASVTPALAADLPARTAPPAAPVLPEWNPWMVRVRALVVMPDESARLYTGGARINGASVDISTSVVPELDISYFFTKNIAAELVLGVTKHDTKGTGVLAGTKIGSTWLLPPTLTLQYHFTDFGAFKPYLGIGVNYTTYFDSKPAGGFTRFKLGDTWGLALQAGADYMINEHWGINVDLKKIMFMEPVVSVNRHAVYGRAKINPWLIGTGITYKF